MIGQKKLKKTINSFSNLPHSLLLIGERGSEETEVADYIAKKFELVSFDLGEVLSKELLDQIYESHTKSLYVVNLLDISPDKQNLLLKFYEEPTPYAYVLLFTENESTVLETILTRSYTLKMDQYSEEELRKSSAVNFSNPLVYKICHTPGQLELAVHTDIQKLYSLCTAIVESMTQASYPNALSIADKINYKDEYDKYDLYLFLKLMRQVLLEKNKYDWYKSILEIDKYIWQMNNKKIQIESLLTDLWLDAHGLQKY